MRRAQDRAQSARFRKNRARSATFKNSGARPRRAQTCERSAQWECARQAGRFFFIYLYDIYKNIIIKNVFLSKITILHIFYRFGDYTMKKKIRHTGIWNLSVEKETHLTVSGFEPGSFDCRSTALTNWATETFLYRITSFNNFSIREVELKPHCLLHCFDI